MEADARYLRAAVTVDAFKEKEKKPRSAAAAGCAPPRRAEVDPLR